MGIAELIKSSSYIKISLAAAAVLILMVIVAAIVWNKKDKKVRVEEQDNTKQTTFKIIPTYEVSKLTFGNAQHIGKREEQQDSFAISDNNNVDLVREKGVLAIVADGMGGLDNGKESSSLVVSSMLRQFTHRVFLSSIPLELRNMVVETNEELLQHLSNINSTKSGSTLVAVVIKDSKLYWISVGDSRIYLCRGGRLYTLNKDHVYGNELLKEVVDGKITLEEALNHPERRALTSYMGISQLTEIDQNMQFFELLSGDRIILCSDGIYGSLGEAEILEAMNSDAQTSAIELEQKVLSKNFDNQDNMTAIVIGFNLDGTQ